MKQRALLVLLFSLSLAFLSASSAWAEDTYRLRTGHGAANEVFIQQVSIFDGDSWSEWVAPDTSTAGYNHFDVVLPVQTVAMQYVDDQGVTQFFTYDPPQEYLIAGGQNWSASAIQVDGKLSLWQSYDDADFSNLGSTYNGDVFRSTFDLVTDWHNSQPPPPPTTPAEAVHHIDPLDFAEGFKAVLFSFAFISLSIFLGWIFIKFIIAKFGSRYVS